MLTSSPIDSDSDLENCPGLKDEILFENYDRHDFGTDFSPIKKSDNNQSSTSFSKQRRRCSMGAGTDEELEEMMNASIDISPIRKSDSSRHSLRESFETSREASIPEPVLSSHSLSLHDAKASSRSPSKSPFETRTVDLSTMDEEELKQIGRVAECLSSSILSAGGKHVRSTRT